jgi:glyceraldehyde-3-phosphate dehydrogenase (NADP+)
MKERAGKKKIVLELGGNAGVIIDKTADLDWAVKRCLVGAFSYAGQVCISVQRMVIHHDVWVAFMDRFVAGARALKLGDPLDPATDLGPMVDATAAGRRSAGSTRPSRWAASSCWAARRTARSSADHPDRRSAVGAGLLQRGVRTARRGLPVPRARRGDRSGQRSMFGLQTGVFTNDLAGAWKAFAELEVGGVIVNDVPTYRIDHMPYGGVKDSGLGREGLRWAIEDMTEIRIMVLAQPQ